MTTPESLPDEAVTHERREAAFTPRDRQAILDRDNNQCQACGTGGENRLQIHHLTYRSQGGAGTQENGVTLCHGCHHALHQGWLTIQLYDIPGRGLKAFCRRTPEYYHHVFR